MDALSHTPPFGKPPYFLYVVMGLVDQLMITGSGQLSKKWLCVGEISMIQCHIPVENCQSVILDSEDPMRPVSNVIVDWQKQTTIR